MHRILIVVLALALAAAAFVGLPSDGGTRAQAGTSAESYNRTDRAFAASMLPHHEGGVKLGGMAADKGVDSDIRRLGRDIVSAQTREARTLRNMVRRFRTAPSMPEAIMQRDMLDMRALQAATGTEFDRRWIDVISAHHSAAIQMAQIEVQGGRNRAARRLARSIVVTQKRELEQFNRLAFWV
jgi:uncharacterized protein (DUF305 family)